MASKQQSKGAATAKKIRAAQRRVKHFSAKREQGNNTPSVHGEYWRAMDTLRALKTQLLAEDKALYYELFADEILAQDDARRSAPQLLHMIVMSLHYSAAAIRKGEASEEHAGVLDDAANLIRTALGARAP